MARIIENRAAVITGAIAIVLVATGCAKEGMPSGGPVDTGLPEIVEVSPEPRSVNVHTATPIVFSFSEAMNHDTVEQAIRITPDIGSTFRHYWRGRELHLDPMVPYRENTTIVITIGADAADMRRNRLGTSYTLAFSTGSGLDDATVTGAVMERGVFMPGAWIWIYPLPTDPQAADQDPSPFLPLREILPLYVTQADDAGRFRQSNLAVGLYRVFAFIDQDGNSRWDRATDPLAVPPITVGFSQPDEVVEDLMLNLAPRDTTGPSLRSAAAANSRQIQLRFTEPPAPGSDPRISFEAVVEEGADPPAVPAVTVLGSWIPWDSPANLNLLVEGLAAEQRYEAVLLEAVDELGNPGRRSTRPVTFSVPARADTTHPLITAIDPGDSTRVLNRDRTIRVTFATEIETDSVGEWSLSGPDTTGTVELEMKWLDPRTLDLTPVDEIVANAFYRLIVPALSLTSWTGLSGPVEEQSFAWQGVQEQGRGTLRLSVEGVILPPDGKYRVFIEGMGTGTTPLTRLDFASREEFITPELLEGAYRVWGFADVDGDGILYPGQATPWQPAEAVGAISDTLYVIDSFESVYEIPLVLRPVKLNTEEEVPPR